MMAISDRGIQREREIKVKRQKLVAVTTFTYFEAYFSDNDSKPLSSKTQATSALTKLKLTGKDNSKSFESQQMPSLVISVFL